MARGRRPGPSTTRDDIADAARATFAARGYEGATVREIARCAKVDAALVSHHFGSKQQLFTAVVEPPIDVTQVLPMVFAGDPDGLGERVAQLVVGVLGDDDARARIVGLVRAAASGPEGAGAVREIVSTRTLGALASALPGEDGEARAALAGSQIIGMVVARHIVALEPLASMSDEQLVAYLGPTLQRYLIGDASSA